METRVTPEDNRDLVAPITDEEIMEAAFQIPSSRAPGPDGFSGCFYKDHWTTVGEDVVKTIKAFWHSGTLLRKLNHTNLVLIPKVKCPKNMTQLRPIALCNVSYKILAKVITNRLKKVMPKTKKKIGKTLGIQYKDGFGKYLGLQADFGLSKKVVFAEIRDKIEARLVG
ncbi:hypothetical protein ACFX16_002817 [Malus domestica]